MRESPSFCKALLTPAKINLGLRVVRRRSDGYHDIYSVMEPISLADMLYCEFTPAPDSDFSLDCPQLPALAGEDNLVLKAARRMVEIAVGRGCPKTGSWKFFLDKKIPTGAGLGGGSSNAAAVINLLDNFLELNLQESELLAAAAAVGADVPFFLKPGLVLVTGIGDHLTRLGPPRPRYYLLVKPPFSVDTAWAYSALNLGRATRMVSYDVGQFQQGVSTSGYELENDFEIVVSRRYPLLDEIRQRLAASAGCLGARMSGSGSVIYAVYADLENALLAESRMQQSLREQACRFYVARNLRGI
ncbi:MAG: 4-(cytidine 5'-diphospho)-2-C-methyl-D-erythritol kinase [Deltaproteobacteria bacterium]|nr:4-(cytidine 5'-diphospho)-2-C-methyl-D-erythritol kinase [Deltaproteobacteria bacterium]